MSKLQPFDFNDEFHALLSAVNSEYGRGDITAIVWDRSDYVLRGMYITQLQYGQAVYRFHVQPCSNGFTLKVRGRTINRVSDYFN